MWDISVKTPGKMREVSIILGHRHHFWDILNVGREWREEGREV